MPGIRFPCTFAAFVAAGLPAGSAGATFTAKLNLDGGTGACGGACANAYRQYDGMQYAVGNNCDTLGFVGDANVFNSGIVVDKFHVVTEPYVDPNGADGHVYVTFFENVYCTGPPVEWEQPWKGQFRYNDHEGWYQLDRPRAIHSVRTTWVPAGGAGVVAGGQRPVAAKLVLWPLFNMDAQLGTIDEFTCGEGSHYDVGISPAWKNSCASPVDRIYCLEAGADAWGMVDNMVPMDFAGDTNFPLRWGFSNQKDLSWYPMGSGRIARYFDSWHADAQGSGVCSASVSGHDHMQPGQIIVTKLYEVPCPQAAPNLQAWCSGAEKVTLTVDYNDNVQNCVNSGPNSPGSFCRSNPGGTWPQKVMCSWTRLVDVQTRGCGNLVGFPNNSLELLV